MPTTKEVAVEFPPRAAHLAMHSTIAKADEERHCAGANLASASL